MKIELGFSGPASLVSRPITEDLPSTPSSALSTHPNLSARSQQKQQCAKDRHQYLDLANLAVRVVPFEDESLFSFLHRLTTANGIPHPLTGLGQSKNNRSKDWDMCMDENQLRQLALRTQLPIERLVKMTFFKSWPPPYGFVLASSPLSNHSRPQQFCPDCLAHDPEPYLRKEWRNSYVVACAEHVRLLRTSCPHCGSPFLPFTSANFTTLSICPHCHQNLCCGKEDSINRLLVKRALPLQGVIQSHLKRTECWPNKTEPTDSIPLMGDIGSLCKRAVFDGFVYKHMNSLDEILRCGLENHAKLCKERSSLESSSGRATFRWIDFGTTTRATAMSIASGWISAWPQTDGLPEHWCNKVKELASHIWPYLAHVPANNSERQKGPIK